MTRLRNFWLRVQGLIGHSISRIASDMSLKSAMRVHSYFGTFHTLGHDGSTDV
jgi:hypothetical protein